MAGPRAVSWQKAWHEWRLYLFVLPALLLVLTFSYFPALSAVYHSFFEWQGGEFKQAVGLANFERVFSDRMLWGSFVTVFILIAANVVKLVPSIVMAVVVHRLRSDAWQYFYRVMLVVPMIVPGLVTLFIWKFYFDPSFGLINSLLDWLYIKPWLVWLDANFLHWDAFLENAPIGWLSHPKLVLPAMIFWGFPWIGAVGVLIFLAGLQAIGTEVYEAAELDGANWFQKFLYIELPLIMTQVRLMLVLMVIGTIQGFGFQLLLLGDSGGPNAAGMVPGLWMYNQAFTRGEFGYACAVGMVLFVFILVLTLIQTKYVRVEK